MTRSSALPLRTGLAEVAFSLRKSLELYSGWLGGLLLIVLIAGLGSSSASAQSFPDLVGTYSGSGSGEHNECVDPAENFLFTMVNPVLSIDSQTDGSFSGRLTFDFDRFATVIDISGTVDGSRNLSGTIIARIFEQGVLADTQHGSFTGMGDGTSITLDVDGPGDDPSAWLEMVNAGLVISWVLLFAGSTQALMVFVPVPE